MTLPHVEIEFPKGVGRNAIVKLNGGRVPGVHTVHVEAAVGGMVKVTLGIYTSRVDMEGDADVLARFVPIDKPLSDDTTVADEYRHYVAKE